MARRRCRKCMAATRARPMGPDKDLKIHARRAVASRSHCGNQAAEPIIAGAVAFAPCLSPHAASPRTDSLPHTGRQRTPCSRAWRRPHGCCPRGAPDSRTEPHRRPLAGRRWPGLRKPQSRPSRPGDRRVSGKRARVGSRGRRSRPRQPSLHGGAPAGSAGRSYSTTSPNSSSETPTGWPS